MKKGLFLASLVSVVGVTFVKLVHTFRGVSLIVSSGYKSSYK